jgi:hypothetical protein
LEFREAGKGLYATLLVHHFILLISAAWLNGFAVVHPNMHSSYTLSDFDEDLRKGLCRAGCKGEKVILYIEGGNVHASFLERLNTLVLSTPC